MLYSVFYCPEPGHGSGYSTKTQVETISLRAYRATNSTLNEVTIRLASSLVEVL